MPTLGEKHFQLEIAEANEIAVKQTAANQARDLAEQARREVVRNFFADAQRTITACIEAGKIPPPFITPAEVTGNILDPSHSDYGLYLEFSDWAQSEGLSIESRHENIGGRLGAKFFIKSEDGRL
jgi:hypothetical protein